MYCMFNKFGPRNDEGEIYLLDVVKRAEKDVLADPSN